MKKLTSILLPVLLLITPHVSGHGRLMQPVGRSSAWRLGFPTPPNYSDNELNCGGFANQWGNHDGKCGLCGDPYQGPRENEAGGQYATGTIVKTYTSGSLMEVSVQITANHMGWHEFRLCKNDNPDKVITQQCLDAHLLPEAGTGETRLYMSSSVPQNFSYTLQLPSGLICSQCVLQWKWHCGNNWGTDPISGESGVGLGPQEQFYGCSDVTITGAGGDTTSSTTTPTTRRTSTASTTTPPSNTSASTTASTTASSPTTTVGPNQQCHAIGAWEGDPAKDKWCEDNCRMGYCPPEFCVCTHAKYSVCVELPKYSAVPGMRTLCQLNCARGHCPKLVCGCK